MSFKVFDSTIQFPHTGLDAFNRLKVSAAYTQFEGMNLYGGADPQGFRQNTASGGTITYLTNEASWNLAVPVTSGAFARVTSKEYFTYHPGKSQLIIMTGVLGDQQTNTVKRIGYFDANDGIYFVQDGANGLGVGIRTSTSGSPQDTIIYQADWNADKMDGTGKSGLSVNVANAQIFLMDFQWLGVGTVRFGFEIDGQLYLCHAQHHSNKIDKVYMKSGSLPLRYEIVNTGTAPAPAELKSICSTVITEGGTQNYGFMYATPNSAPVTVASGTWTPVVSVKANTALNGYQYRGSYIVQSLEIFVDGNQPMAFAVFETANIATPTWVSMGANTALEYDLTAATMNVATTTSTRRMTSFVPANERASLVVDPAELLRGVANTSFTLAALGISGSSTVRAAINVREIL